MKLKDIFSKSKTHYQVVLEKLNASNSQEVIKAAMQLGNHNSPEAIELLLKRLTDQDEKVRGACAEALGNLAHFHRPDIIEPLVECLNDPCDEVRFSAVLALGKTKDEVALAPIVAVLKQDANPFVRDNAAKALENFCYEESLTALTKTLNDSNEMVRSTAAGSLNAIIEPDLINTVVSNAMLPLIHALKTIDHNGRTAAAEALGKIGNPKAITHLTRLLDDNKIEVKAAARDAIDNINALIEYERRRDLAVNSSASTEKFHDSTT